MLFGTARLISTKCKNIDVACRELYNTRKKENQAKSSWSWGYWDHSLSHYQADRNEFRSLVEIIVLDRTSSFVQQLGRGPRA